MSALVDEIDQKVGLKQLKLLHVNDSRDERGSNRDRHTAIGKGKIGRKGIRNFLSEPRLQDVPAVFEGPGLGGGAPIREDIQLMRRLWREGTRARSG
jgi:deoxyribonuclease-4